MSHALDLHGLHHVEDLLDVDSGGFHCAVSERGAVKGHVPVGAGDFHHFADEGEAIGVRAGASQTDHNVARFDALAVDNFVFFNDAHSKACEVVFAIGVHTRHFGRFAADQRAAGEFATVSDALDNAFGRVDVELSATEVVKEEEALGTLHEDVVDAHGDQILTHRIMTVKLEGEHELCSHAVGT